MFPSPRTERLWKQGGEENYDGIFSHIVQQLLVSSYFIDPALPGNKIFLMVAMTMTMILRIH